MGNTEPTRGTAMWNPFANMATLAGKAITIVRGEGSTVVDSDGHEYLDALASLWYCNIGYGRTELADAAAVQMRQLAGFQIFEYFTNPPAEALANRVASLAPMADAKVILTPGGGSDAVDTAGKLARAYWRAVGQPTRQVIISRTHAYHGMNAYGTSLGGIPLLTEAYAPLVGQVEQVPWDNPEALEKTIELIGDSRVAAFFCEPVIGAGGVYPPPEGYLRAVRDICRRHNVLFVADEVITGYGRTGEWFASGRFELDPDLITTAKGLSSGYLPIGAVIAGPRVAEPFWHAGTTEVFRHGYTYSGHPAAAAVALANLDILEREQLIPRVAALEPVLARAVTPLADHQLVSAVRSGTGLLAAVEIAEEARLADPMIGQRLVLGIRKRGVITRLLRNVALQISPPFVITEEEIGRIVAALAGALDEIERSRKRIG
ncbi:MAG TPA: aminotransferase class III-fold pyridoxal phosphate-dependent enzyme [Streptosporangiaceae bacterium]|nr:aminotransferase class III-fold pyridoxal phosphate-dependent enzyme [Streptosporangiaceae bacterium]